MDKEWNDDLSQYIKQKEPDKVEKAKAWKTAIGLQDVDGLKPSMYLLEMAKNNIEGNIGIEEANRRINNYYKEENKRKTLEGQSEEADKVSVRIAKILSEKAFSFSITELLSIHKSLFDGIFKGAGKFRDYNITKEEWVLNGDTVIYSSYESIRETLAYDFEQEKNFSYKDMGINESIRHLCRFLSNIWQVHPFCEGNTRTTAVFFIKYLKTFGFNINHEIFAKNSWYFRNALVRANYKNFNKNVFEDYSYLEKFFYNLLTGTNYELRNRYLNIDNEKSHKDHKEKKENDYTLEEQAIVNIIRDNPYVTQKEIADKIDKSLRMTKIYMSNMQEKGLIKRENGKRNGKWIVIN